MARKLTIKCCLGKWQFTSQNKYLNPLLIGLVDSSSSPTPSSKKLSKLCNHTILIDKTAFRPSSKNYNEKE